MVSDYPKPMSDPNLVLMSDELPLSRNLARALALPDCRWMVHGRPQAQMTIYGEKGGTKANRLAMRMPKQNRL
ncbi:hypothetical protein DPMN_130155 [Dreissena polymorpha]|uniref:Uncharacterized protein n=1 Tax=Dreissena polymorpha TaxID=45954 RepID=A0A9D4H445_DREPO|nr:hypothetical protein DPMN_130155 [Dreissena polymorpha]